MWVWMDDGKRRKEEEKKESSCEGLVLGLGVKWRGLVWGGGWSISQAKCGDLFFLLLTFNVAN